MIAITRPVPDSLEQCELTHQPRVPIDVGVARREHEEYVAALSSLGCTIVQLPALHDHADSAFVEDTAVIVDELAIVTRPGAPSRRAETASMRTALQESMSIAEIVPPGTLDGGDVLRVGRRIFVGISTRTNASGAAQLKALLEPHGYTVSSVGLNGVLHLKSAATAVAPDLVVVNPHAIAPETFGVPYLSVPMSERFAANVLAVQDRVLCPLNAQRTAELLTLRGFDVIAVANSELAKAEAGITCCCVLLST